MKTECNLMKTNVTRSYFPHFILLKLNFSIFLEFCASSVIERELSLEQFF